MFCAEGEVREGVGSKVTRAGVIESRWVVRRTSASLKRVRSPPNSLLVSSACVRIASARLFISSLWD
jgi:transposase